MERSIQYFEDGFIAVDVSNQAVKKASHGTPSFGDLESQLADLRRQSEATEERLRQGSNDQPRASQGAGDVEYRAAVKAKRQYFQQCEDEENQLVADSVFLAAGGKKSALMGSMRILNPATSQRVKAVASRSRDDEEWTEDDEKWLVGMLGLAGQKGA
jgi:hypothetical protein